MAALSNPWIKFYPRDWRGDQALRAVSIAARGLWIECLCIMHEAKPYGHLVLNGEPVEDATLARMTGVPVDEVSALMSELRQAGVLSVTGKGVVFSRRMTKDHARSRKGKIAAGKRWSQVSDGVEQSGAPNGSPSRRPITQKPEARSQNTSCAAGGPHAFESFWSAYPSRGKAANPKKPAQDKFERLVRDGVDPAEIIRGTKAYAVAQRELGNEGERAHFVMQATRFLNQAVWRDYLAANGKAPQPVTEDDWEKRLQWAREHSAWPRQRWGGMPWEDGCVVPDHLLRPADGKNWAEWTA